MKGAAFMAYIKNTSKDEFLEQLPTDGEKKIALMLYAKGYSEGIEFCNNEIKKR